MEQASAIYEPMIPMGWIGAEPADRHATSRPGPAVPDDWDDVVVNRSLGCGVAVTATRRGFIVYDFAGWPAGVPSRPVSAPGHPTVVTLGQSSAAAKLALVQRLRVINLTKTLAATSTRSLPSRSMAAAANATNAAAPAARVTLRRGATPRSRPSRPPVTGETLGADR